MAIDSSNSTTLFESPAAQVEALDYPDDLRKQLKEIYDGTLPEGQTGGLEVTRLRLTSNHLSSLETEGEWKEEEGWVVIQCVLTGTRFVVPEDETVPTLEVEYQFADDTESVFHRPVHPELTTDRSKVALHFVAKLARKIRDRLMDLIGVAAKLEALSEMDELPNTAGNEPAASRRSRCDYESIDPLP